QGELMRWAERATVLAGVPRTCRMLTQGTDVSSLGRLRLVTLAGQATNPADRRAFSRALPKTEFVHFYGLTEATTRVLWLPAEEFLSNIESTGRAIPGVHAWTDADGELWVEGPNVAEGYLDDPEATRARFPAGRLRTGDLFESTAGLFRYLG